MTSPSCSFQAIRIIDEVEAHLTLSKEAAAIVAQMPDSHQEAAAVLDYARALVHWTHGPPPRRPRPIAIAMDNVIELRPPPLA